MLRAGQVDAYIATQKVHKKKNLALGGETLWEMPDFNPESLTERSG